MGLLSALRSRPIRPWKLAGSLISSLALAGCAGMPKFPHAMYLTVGSNPDQVIDAGAREEVQTRLNTLEGGYRQIHPQARFQFSLYPEESLLSSTKRRNQAGLGPDLLLVNGATALRLLETGIVDPFPATPDELAAFEPNAIARIRDKQGRLAGIPVLVQTQVACFNRKRLPEAPTTMKELLEAGASGHPIGLSADVINLFWTAGSLGAVSSINKVARGQPIDEQDQTNLIRWLSWLQNASSQLRVTFFNDQQTVTSEFLAGRLDWIPCNSVSLTRFRKTLGKDLGVSALPNGAKGKASPINRLRVLALGSSSSTAGRARALTFTSFATNPLMQRALTLGSQTVLPANRFVMVPVQSSETLKAMVTSYQEGQAITPALESIAVRDQRIIAVQEQIVSLLFGENSPELAAEALTQLFRKQR